MITVDSRMGSKELFPLFPPEVSTCIGLLDYGDMFFLGNGEGGLVTVGVERKAMQDLMNSMTTGRFSGHQLPGLIQQYDYVYLIVEGVWRFNPDTGILESQQGAFWLDVTIGSRRFMAKEVVGFLNTIAIKTGVHIMYTQSRRETVQTVVSLYHWWNSKQFDAHTSHLSPSKVHRGDKGEISLIKPPLVRRVAAELSMIGWGKSKAVADYFPTVLDMVIAEEEDWMEIPGIGRTIARNAVKELREEKEE